jgi:hypothetical protein
MRRGWAVLALGLGLLAASFGRAGEGPESAPPPQPQPGLADNGGNGALAAAPALTPTPNGGPCGGCCGHAHRSCLEQLVGLFCYRALPVPPCCRQCPLHCHRSCGCMPPAYVYFLGETCHEGHYYGSTCRSCGGCCGCGPSAPRPGPGVIPPPGVPLTGVVPPPQVPYPAQGEPQTVLPPPTHP